MIKNAAFRHQCIQISGAQSQEKRYQTNEAGGRQSNPPDRQPPAQNRPYASLTMQKM
jgi:hypothetical protein